MKNLSKKWMKGMGKTGSCGSTRIAKPSDMSGGGRGEVGGGETGDSFNPNKIIKSGKS